MTTAVKVAFATSDMTHVDQHFGAAQSFAIYTVEQDRHCFVEAAEFGNPDAAPAHNASGQNEDKLAAKIRVLEGCIAVYSQAVGASAINQLRAKGIQPVKVAAGAQIGELLASLQEEMKQGASSWVARAMENAMPADPSRFDRMEEEGWQE